MRAIEYGLLHNGNYAYKDIRHNIYAFNERIIVSNEENSQEQASYTEIVYAQVEEIQEESNSFKIIKKGQIIDSIEGNYLLNSDAVTVSEISETATVHLNISSITAPVYKFGEAFFALVTRVNINDVEWSFLLENVEVPPAYFQAKRKREKITLLNHLLDEQKLSVIVYVSTDGALLETAYQAIDSLYPNEIVLFIETNDKANMFGSVVRIKTGENVDSTSGVPYKKLSKIVDYFEAKIDSSSLLEIIKEHVNDKSSNLFLVKKTLWGLFDKVVTLSSGLALETIQTVSEGIAEVINVFKIDDSRWMYYDEQGKPLKEHNLFLSGIENILALQEANKSHPWLDTSKTNSEAIKKITFLENALKSQRQNLGKAKFFKKIIDQQLNMLSKVKDFLKDPLQQQLEAVETSFVVYNAFIVGLINSIIDAVKGVFDMITLICQGLIALKDKAINMAQNLTSYFSLLFEMIENQTETLTNIFSKENLNALFVFFKECGILALTLPAKFFSWVNESVEMPNLDKVAYYMGYIIGFIIHLILEILFTGGAKTVADAFAKLAESLMAVFKTMKGVAFKLKKGAVIVFENLLGIFAYIREKSKKLAPLLENILKWLNSIFRNDELKLFFQKLGVELKKVPTSAPLFSGVPVKLEDSIYALLKDGKEIFRGTKREVDAVAEKLKGMSDTASKSYLDELVEKINLRTKALKKWGNKFDETFVNHLSGDVEILEIKVKLDSVWRPVESWFYVGTRGRGGHWLNKFLTVDKITFPPGISKVAQLADDIPFKATVTIKSLKGKKFPKFEESSMFPKNWSLERIQEEIAFVYENTVAKGVGKLQKGPTDLFDKYENFTTNGFKIRVEVDDLGNIMNAYPII